MPRFARLAAVLALAALTGCAGGRPDGGGAAGGTPAETRVVGRWEMSRVLDRGQEATAAHNPAGDRYVVLRADGTFESGGRPYGRNTGRWSFDPAFRELTLDSDLGPADDTFWIVAVEGDEMEWAGVRSETARRFRIFSQRAGR